MVNFLTKKLPNLETSRIEKLARRQARNLRNRVSPFITTKITASPNPSLALHHTGESALRADRVSLFFPSIDSLAIKLYISQAVGDRDFLVYISKIDGKSTKGKNLGNNWEYSEIIDGKYRYIPTTSANKVIRLPLIEFPTPATKIEWGIIPWGKNKTQARLPHTSIEMVGKFNPARKINFKRVVKREEIC